MRYYFFFFFCLLRLLASAQTTITGRVLMTDNEAVTGGSVFIQGTYDGATTDSMGVFRFNTAETGTVQLWVLYMGCDTFRQQITPNGTPISLEIRLKAQKNQLNEVVVTAGTFEATSDRRRAAVLSSIDIALTASASADIAGAITMLPGTTRNGETGQILVRGGAAYETRTFMDGLLVQNPYNSTTGNLPARNRFSPFLFKGTVFSTGGYSAEYGQAMSSALILNTEDLAPKTTTGITLLSVGGGLSHTHRWANTSVSATGSYGNLSPYFALVPQKPDWIRAPQSGSGEFVVRHKTNDRGGMLKFYSNINRSGLRMNYPSETENGRLFPLQLKADNVYTNISYRDMVGKNWTLFAGAAFTYNDDQINSRFTSQQRHRSLQSRATLSRSINNTVKVKFGGEYYQSNYREKAYLAGQYDFNNPLKDHYGASFAEADLFLSSKWVGRVGGRSEYSALLNRFNIAPRASVAYILGKKEQISFSFGQFHQTPEYAQMRYTQALDFEHATHAMLNYQVMRNGLIFRVEAYQKWYQQLTKTDKNGATNNSGNGYARGLDFFFRDNHHIKNGDYWVSYSYLDTKRNWRNFPQTATPNFAMKHSLSVVYKQFFPKINTAFSASYAFNSGRPYDNPNLAKSQFNTSRTPVYHDLSIAVTYLTNVRGHFTIIYLSLQNVPGFKQVFGYQYNSTPDSTGIYPAKAITPPAKRFGVLAVIMSIGQQYKKSETTSDDY